MGAGWMDPRSRGGCPGRPETTVEQETRARHGVWKGLHTGLESGHCPRVRRRRALDRNPIPRECAPGLIWALHPPLFVDNITEGRN